MPHALQSILTQVGLAIAPLRAIDTPEKATAFFRQLGYEISPSAFGGALPTSHQAGDGCAASSLLAEQAVKKEWLQLFSTLFRESCDC